MNMNFGKNVSMNVRKRKCFFMCVQISDNHLFLVVKYIKSKSGNFSLLKII
jgi:hypothetical protein